MHLSGIKKYKRVYTCDYCGHRFPSSSKLSLRCEVCGSEKSLYQIERRLEAIRHQNEWRKWA